MDDPIGHYRRNKWMVNETLPSLGRVPVRWLASEHVDGGLVTHNARHWGVVGCRVLSDM
jgi:hypothetical protein